MRRIARHIYHVGVILIFVLVATAGFTQTKAFKTYFLSMILDEINSTVNGSVWVSTLDGNLITGLRLRDIEIAAGNDELARIEEIRVSYDLVGFLLGNVRLSNVEVIRPSFSLYRGMDGSWNLDRFLPPPAEEGQDSLSTIPTITIRRIQIQGARFRMVDSVALASWNTEEIVRPLEAVDYADLDASMLNVDAGITLSPLGTKIDLSSLSFDLPRHQISVKRISGSFELLADATRLEEVEILSDRSRVSLDLRLSKGIGDIAGLYDLRDVETELTLRAHDLDIPELRAFVYPDLEFLDGTVNLDLEMAGPFNRLSVNTFSLRTPGSFIRLQGVLSNLHNPEYLQLAIQSEESVVQSDDIQALLPGLSIPSWKRFGDVGLFFSFHGDPQEFDATVTARSERGSAEIVGHFARGEYFRYNGTVVTQDLDLGGVLGDGTEISKLNARIEVDGSGTELASLISFARVAIDTSRIGSIDVQRSVVILDAAQGSFSGHAETVTDAGSVTITGRWALGKEGEITSYTAQGSTRGLDMAPIAGVSSYTSDLNMGFDIAGQVTERGSRDSVRLNLLESSFGAYTIPASVVNVRQNLEADERTITLESVPANLQISGTFEPADLPIVGEYAIAMLQDHAEETFGELGKLRSLGPDRERRQRLSSRPIPEFDTSDVRLDYELRSLEPLAALIGLRVTGDARGSFDFVGAPDDFQVSGRLKSRYFDLEDPSVSLAGKNTSLDFFADRLLAVRGRDHDGTSLTLGVDALLVNGTLLSSVALRTDVQDSVGMVSIDSFIDSTVHVSGIGALQRTDQFATFVFDQFRVEANAFTLQTRDSVVVHLGSDGVLLERAVFGSEDESVMLSGIFDPTGVSDMLIALSNFSVHHLPEIVAHSPMAATIEGLSGRVDATVTFRGSLNHPNMQLDLTGKGIRMDRISFGRVAANVKYFERVLTTDISLIVAENGDAGSPDLLLRGSVPYDFVLAGEKSEDPLDGEIDLVMISTGIDLKFFEPFLVSVTRELEGTLTCNIRMQGDVDEPRYQGMATIRNAQFLFVPTRLKYRLDGNFLTAGDKLQLQNVIIRNTEADYADGMMRASGSLALSGIALQGFDLGFNGELRLMREDSSRMLGNKYYGDLTVATTGQGLSWIGTVDRSKLSGQLQVRNAQLTLPPDREGQQYSTRLIDIIRDPDSSGARARLAITARDQAFAISESGPVEDEKSFVDRIDFDLSLETQGSTQIRFIFNAQANDVLFADLRGRLSFLRDEGSTRLIGDIEVTDRSYYNFLKRFSASGRMLFTGDPLNPELDIIARYQGIHKKALQNSAATPDGSPQQTVDERTTVVLYLQGPRSKLETRFEVEVENPNSTEGFVKRTGDVEADAIAFIMTSQFRDELTEQQQGNLLGENLGYGLASGLLTGPLSETLRRTTRGSIQSLDVIYYGGGQFTQGADVRLTGQLGQAVYRVGGRVFDSIGNTNVVIEIPLSVLLNSNELRNLVLTLERRVEGTETLEDQRRSSNEARLQYRIRF